MSKFSWNIMAAAILVHWNLEIVLSANLEIKIKGLTNARECSVIQTGNTPHHSSCLFCHKANTTSWINHLEICLCGIISFSIGHHRHASCLFSIKGMAYITHGHNCLEPILHMATFYS